LQVTLGSELSESLPVGYAANSVALLPVDLQASQV
jgi:hypothetical protein